MPRNEQRHTGIKRRLAGPSGKVEKPLPGGRKLDVRRQNVAIEIERSGQPARLRLAAQRLATQNNAAKRLQVPQPDMEKAIAAAKAAGVTLTVENLSRTRRRRVNP